METKKIGKHILAYSKFKYNNFSQIKDYISNNSSFLDLLNSLSTPMIVVLGGDGTMLKSINKYHDLGYGFLGINFGNKGFLLNPKEYISETSDFDVVNYSLIECIVKTSDSEKVGYFFNEINITSSNGSMLDLNIGLKSGPKINIMGDGIIVATSPGSTGYNSSLGGPIIPHNLDALLLTPKAAWKPKGQHPIVLKGTEEIYITTSKRYDNYEIYLDGNNFYSSIGLEANITIKKSTKNIKLLVDSNYRSIWDNKVLNEQGFIL